MYISSQLVRREFRPIDKVAPKFLYCGSVRLGRNLALVEIADALRDINPEYVIDVYSSETDGEICKSLIDHPNINFGGKVGYERVAELIKECDVFVVAEGFRERDLLFTRYSLSTKAADGLASGATVLAYGPAEAGVIEYLASTGAAAICDERERLVGTIWCLINDVAFQKQAYTRAVEVTHRNHTLEASTKAFSEIVEEALSKSKREGR